MVRLDRIVTRGGDGGETSLGDGRRVGKDTPRIEALGALDEASCAIGLARLHLASDKEADDMLARVQNDLFDLGADLAVPPEAGGRQRLRIAVTHIARLEAEVAALNATLKPLGSFILPGGSPAAAHVHLARALVRRAERAIVALARGEACGPHVLPFINRLSDHLFVLARRLNDNGGADVLWKPGENR